MTVEIANVALDRCSVAPIRSLDEQTGTALTIERHYERSVDWVLRRSLWSSLLTIEVPKKTTATAAQLAPHFEQSYHLPEGFIRMYRVWMGDGRWIGDDDWRVVNAATGTGTQRALVTRAEATQIEFTKRPADLNGLPESIKDLISLKLAQSLIIPLKVTENRRDQIEAEFLRVLQEATGEDGSQDAEEIDWAGGDITNARLGLWHGHYYHRG